MEITVKFKQPLDGESQSYPDVIPSFEAALSLGLAIILQAGLGGQTPDIPQQLERKNYSKLHTESSVRFPIIDSDGAVRSQSQLARTAIDESYACLVSRVSFRLPCMLRLNE